MIGHLWPRAAADGDGGTLRLQLGSALVELDAHEALSGLAGYVLVRALEIDPAGARAWIELQARAHLTADRLRALGEYARASGLPPAVEAVAELGAHPARDTLPAGPMAPEKE